MQRAAPCAAAARRTRRRATTRDPGARSPTDCARPAASRNSSSRGASRRQCGGAGPASDPRTTQPLDAVDVVRQPGPGITELHAVAAEGTELDRVGEARRRLLAPALDGFDRRQAVEGAVELDRREERRVVLEPPPHGQLLRVHHPAPVPVLPPGAAHPRPARRSDHAGSLPPQVDVHRGVELEDADRGRRQREGRPVEDHERVVLEAGGGPSILDHVERQIAGSRAPRFTATRTAPRSATNVPRRLVDGEVTRPGSGVGEPRSSLSQRQQLSIPGQEPAARLAVALPTSRAVPRRRSPGPGGRGRRRSPSRRRANSARRPRSSPRRGWDRRTS